MMNIQCKICNKEKSIQERYIKPRGNFCSKKCLGKFLRKEEERVCEFCNNNFYAPPSKIKEGKAKFYSKDCQYNNARKKVEGKKFGKLTVLNITNIKSRKQFLWDCICECGKKANLISTTLLNGNTKSCGCGQPRKKNKFGEASINAHFCNYKAGASRRGWEFSLSREYFEKIVLDDCYYCGNLPKIRQNNGNYNGNIPVNGIDRINNSIGYTEENSVPCCSTCNFMKMKLNDDVFLSQVEKIHNFQQNKKSEFPISYLTVIS